MAVIQRMERGDWTRVREIYVEGIRTRRATFETSAPGWEELERLVSESENEGIWTLQGGIFPENAASIALCRKMGFREVGRRERIGRLDGEWKDVLLLERRSPAVGV